MNIHRFILGGMCSVVVSACAAAEEDPGAGPIKERVAASEQAITATGLSHYCSKVWTSTNGWTVNWGVSDPCSATTGGSVKRAGVYSTSGLNNVVMWCDPNYVWIYSGYGADPIGWAYQEALNTQTSGGCVLTAAPANLPIFSSPFDPATANVTHLTGFDFARPPYNNLDVQDFGQTGSQMTPIVDYMGRDKCVPFTSGPNVGKCSVGSIDNHDAQDWLMPRGTPIRAVADGQLIVAGSFPGCMNDCDHAGVPDSGPEWEVVIRHELNEPIGLYDEYFASGYYHMQALAAGMAPSVQVHKGDIIGYSGNRAPDGGSSAPHLHFAVWRLTNTARDFVVEGFTAANYPNVGPAVIVDPYGFQAPGGFDPWGYMAYLPSAAFPNGAGALSIHLWDTDPKVNSW